MPIINRAATPQRILHNAQQRMLVTIKRVSSDDGAEFGIERVWIGLSYLVALDPAGTQAVLYCRQGSGGGVRPVPHRPLSR
eukprot:scaffold905_cov223-Alexandrium_tamarense.AAC.33